MVSAGAGARNCEGRRSRLPGFFADELEGDESFTHKRSSPKRATVSKEYKELVGSDKEEDKYQKAKIFSRKLGLLLLIASAATVVTIVYDGSVYSNYIRSLTEQAEDFKDDAFSADRAKEGMLPGCTVSKSSWKTSVFNSAFGKSFSNCYLPKGASFISWMRNEYPHHGQLKIGLINVGREDERKWQQFTQNWGKLHLFPFPSVSSLGLKWDDFYPEWIDEEEVDSAPKCPHLPLPSVSSGVSLDVVITNVPGACFGKESRRDIRRLQIMLAGATVASQTQSIVIMIISKCRPLVNLFTWDELLEVKDDVWLFQVDSDQLRKRLAVPVGSCELALPLHKMGGDSSGIRQGLRSKKSSLRVRQEAYATILHSDGVYVCGAIVMGHSIKLTDARRDMIALVDAGITLEQRRGLKLAGWKLHDIERIKNPKSPPEKYNAWNYSKFRLWQLTQYNKIIFIDADLLVLQNLDALFDLPQLSAIGNDKYLFNSGVMVIEPSNRTFELFMEQINEIESYNGGDQGFLNEIFPWWHRIPKRMNYLKFFWSNVSSTEERKEEVALKTALFQAEPPTLYVIHYLGQKPWLCFRDYDCNWNTNEANKYANDVAHARWWKVHDSMSEQLQQHCLLSTKRKAALEWDRRQAEAAEYEDQHWKRNITDPRLQICNQRFCYWESMLWHWGEGENQTQTLPEAQRKPTNAVGR